MYFSFLEVWGLNFLFQQNYLGMPHFHFKKLGLRTRNVIFKQISTRGSMLLYDVLATKALHKAEFSL